MNSASVNLMVCSSESRRRCTNQGAAKITQFSPIGSSGEEMATGVEVIVDGGVDGRKVVALIQVI